MQELDVGGDSGTSQTRAAEINWVNYSYRNIASAYVNSIFCHTNTGYSSVSYSESRNNYSKDAIFANSYFHGLNLTGKTSEQTVWIADILTDVEGAPGLMDGYKYTKAGAPVRGVAKSSPLLKRGMNVYEGTDNKTCLYHAAKGSPDEGKTIWQALHSDGTSGNRYLTVEEVAAAGLSLDNAPITDARGIRRPKRFSPGPLDHLSGFMITIY